MTSDGRTHPGHRLALLDVDGTLRDEEGWKAQAPRLVSALREAGLEVALCSGRNTESLQGLAREQPEITLLGAGSGSMVMAHNGSGWDSLARRFLDRDTIDWVKSQADEVCMELWAYTDTHWIVEAVNDRVRAEAHFVGATARQASFSGRDDIVKILAFPLARSHRATLEIIDAQRDLAVAQSYPGYFDIVRAESAAAKGGDVLIEHLGINWDQVIAAGDGENDLGMLSKAGVAFAMAPLHSALLDPAAEGQHRFDCPDLNTVLEQLAELGVTTDRPAAATRPSIP